jgi:hypothetical protein
MFVVVARPMKHLLSIIFLLSFGCLAGYQSLQAQTVLLNYFTVSSDGSDVVLEWEVQDEAAVQEFRIFRRMNDEPTGAHVVTVKPNGLRSYQHLDDGIFKDNGQVISYELQIVTAQRTDTYQASLSHNPTSIQRTWGSIKAMFR